VFFPVAVMAIMALPVTVVAIGVAVISAIPIVIEKAEMERGDGNNHR
jgi:hypothetical protein